MADGCFIDAGFELASAMSAQFGRLRRNVQVVAGHMFARPRLLSRNRELVTQMSSASGFFCYDCRAGIRAFGVALGDSTGMHPA